MGAIRTDLKNLSLVAPKTTPEWVTTTTTQSAVFFCAVLTTAAGKLLTNYNLMCFNHNLNKTSIWGNIEMCDVKRNEIKF
jgi:hypothetical protein